MTADMIANKGVVSLLVKGVLILLLACISLAALFFWPPADDYMKGHAAKVGRLESLGSPKIVLVGGSSVAMSVDSQMIEQAFGMPVVNMGMHAGIGLRLMLDEVVPHLGQGDQLLIVGEYPHLTGILNGETGLIRLVRAEPGLVMEFSSPEQWVSLARNLPGRIKQRIRKWLLESGGGVNVEDPGEETMNRSGFNKQGDLISHLGKKSPGIGKHRAIQSDSIEIDREAMRYLEQRAQLIRQRGAGICWVFPPIPQRDGFEYSDFLERVDYELRTVQGLTVLGKPQGSLYSKEEFYNTSYHLAEKARGDYTKYLNRLWGGHLERKR